MTELILRKELKRLIDLIKSYNDILKQKEGDHLSNSVKKLSIEMLESYIDETLSYLKKWGFDKVKVILYNGKYYREYKT